LLVNLMPAPPLKRVRARAAERARKEVRVVGAPPARGLERRLKRRLDEGQLARAATGAASARAANEA
jgi:hypothetical protein